VRLDGGREILQGAAEDASGHTPECRARSPWSDAVSGPTGLVRPCNAVVIRCGCL
jgi:hypothetical protein